MSQGNPKPGMVRLSYIEDAATDRLLSLLSHAKRTNKSALIREATQAYIRQNDKSGEMRKLGAKLVDILPDSSEERARTEIPPELQQEIADFFLSLRK